MHTRSAMFQQAAPALTATSYFCVRYDHIITAGVVRCCSDDVVRRPHGYRVGAVLTAARNVRSAQLRLMAVQQVALADTYGIYMLQGNSGRNGVVYYSTPTMKYEYSRRKERKKRPHSDASTLKRHESFWQIRYPITPGRTGFVGRLPVAHIFQEKMYALRVFPSRVQETGRCTVAPR